MPPRNDPESAVDSRKSLPVGPDEADRVLAALAGPGHIALGVSGGIDSMALMALAAEWSMRCGGPKLSILTVDHGLRKGSAAEAIQVAKWATQLGLDHHTLEWTGTKPQTGIQKCAREARYGLMVQWCREAGVDTLAVAHTLDDQAETMIMRLARGSGLDGLAAMAPASERDGLRLVRPLLGLSKARLAATLTQRGQPWIEDPSNQDDRYERVRVRTLLGILDEAGLGVEALGRSAARLGTARGALETMTTQAMAEAVTCFDAGFVTVDLVRYLDTLPEIGVRVLARCLQAVGGKERGPGRDSLERVDAALRGKAGRSWTLGGCVIRRRQAKALIFRESGRRSPAPAVMRNDGNPLWDGRFRVAAMIGHDGAEMTVRALDAAGWAKLSERPGQLPAIPAYVGRSLLSVWNGGRLVSVPHLESPGKSKVEADFQERGLLAGAMRQRLIDAVVTANLPPRPIIAARFDDA